MVVFPVGPQAESYDNKNQGVNQIRRIGSVTNAYGNMKKPTK